MAIKDERLIGMDVSEYLREGQNEMKDHGEDLGFYDTLPFAYEKISKDEFERYSRGHKIVPGEAFLADPWHRRDTFKMGDLDPALYDCLIDLEQKLNLIIRHLSLQKEGETVIPREREIRISPSEISFDSEEEFALGDILKAKLILPLYPISFLVFLSEVARVVRLDSGRYEVTVKYLNLKSDEKDKIITYLFKKQRESIRSGKE